jgi:hypothetical protein
MCPCFFPTYVPLKPGRTKHNGRKTIYLLTDLFSILRISATISNFKCGMYDPKIAFLSKLKFYFYRCILPKISKPVYMKKSTTLLTWCFWVGGGGGNQDMSWVSELGFLKTYIWACGRLQKWFHIFCVKGICLLIYVFVISIIKKIFFCFDTDFIAN